MAYLHISILCTIEYCTVPRESETMLQGPPLAYLCAAALYLLLLAGCAPALWARVLGPLPGAATTAGAAPLLLDPVRLRFAAGAAVWLELVWCAAQGVLWSVSRCVPITVDLRSLLL
jgi:hypothetical protein